MRWATYRSELDGLEHAAVLEDDLLHALPADTSLLALLRDDALEAGAQRARTDPFETLPLTRARLLPPVTPAPSMRDFMAFEAHVVTSMPRSGNRSIRFGTSSRCSTSATPPLRGLLLRQPGRAGDVSDVGVPDRGAHNSHRATFPFLVPRFAGGAGGVGVPRLSAGSSARYTVVRPTPTIDAIASTECSRES